MTRHGKVCVRVKLRDISQQGHVRFAWTSCVWL